MAAIANKLEVIWYSTEASMYRAIKVTDLINATSKEEAFEKLNKIEQMKSDYEMFWRSNAKPEVLEGYDSLVKLKSEITRLIKEDSREYLRILALDPL